MNLMDFFEADVKTGTTANTARAIAQEIYADMTDLVHIRQAGSTTGAGHPDYSTKLIANIRELAGELAQLGYEFDIDSPGHIRPATIDAAGTQSLPEMKCSECGGPAFSDLVLAEKKDACYYKVKSRYKVWPSAYASGALVQCRKKGAKNWGSKG